MKYACYVSNDMWLATDNKLNVHAYQRLYMKINTCNIGQTQSHLRGGGGISKDHVQQDSQLSPKREIALSAVPRYWELELMLLLSISDIDANGPRENDHIL